LFLIDWCDDYAGSHDPSAVARFNREFSTVERPQSAPVPILDLTWEALLSSHRSMCPSLPQYFGNRRQINLKRNAIFVDARFVEQATRSLLDTAQNSRPCHLDETLFFAARLFVDFLSIHPFVNGNRRLGMALVSRYLSARGLAVDWPSISRSQCYYWVRCGSKGHFRSLVEGLQKATSVCAG
jgi:fido (protein-threonine AMPylation protein)